MQVATWHLSSMSMNDLDVFETFSFPSTLLGHQNQMYA
jgi:hypothetical protein